jgi:hypothetical protein
MDTRAVHASSEYSSFADEFEIILAQQATDRTFLNVASEFGSETFDDDDLTLPSDGEQQLDTAAENVAAETEQGNEAAAENIAKAIGLHAAPRTPPKPPTGRTRRPAPVGYLSRAGPYLQTTAKGLGGLRPRPPSSPPPRRLHPSPLPLAQPPLPTPPLPPPPLLTAPEILPCSFPPALPIHGGPPLTTLPTDLVIDWNDPEVIRIEQAITFTYGKKFADRGPPPPGQGGPELWRNQAFRAESNRWGNRGGKHRHEWTAKFQAKGKGKGKDKHGGSSSSSSTSAATASSNSTSGTFAVNDNTGRPHGL